MIAYIRSVWACHLFFISLARHDIRKRYRRSIFGASWALLQPVLMALVMCAVFSQAFQLEFFEHFGHVLTGLCFWNFLGYVTTWGCQSIRYGEHYIRQHRAPMAIYPLRFALVAVFHLLVALVPITAVAWLSNGAPNLAAVAYLPITVLVLLVFGWSTATIFGVSNVFFPDSQHICEVGMHVLFYATPIIWHVKMLQGRPLGWLIDYNPLAALVEIVRNPILQGIAPSLEAVRLALGAVALCFVTAAFLLARCERRLIFYL